MRFVTYTLSFIWCYHTHRTYLVDHIAKVHGYNIPNMYNNCLIADKLVGPLALVIFPPHHTSCFLKFSCRYHVIMVSPQDGYCTDFYY